MLYPEQTTARAEVLRLRLVASVKPEAIAFLREHGCAIEQRQQQHEDDLVIFPAGSRQEPMSATSKRCSHILLPDGTCITAMDCYTRFIFLLLDPVQRSCVHLGRYATTEEQRNNEAVSSKHHTAYYEDRGNNSYEYSVHHRTDPSLD